MSGTLLVRAVTVPGRAARQDVEIAAGRIVRIEDAGAVPVPAGATVVEAAGLLLIPGLVDAHCHVDKTLWGGPWEPHRAGSRLVDRIADERARRAELGLPSVENIEALLRHMVSVGTTRIRTHTDVDPGAGLSGIEAVARAAKSVDGLIDVEQVAFPQDGVIRRPGTLELLEAALDAGATTLGGLDPAGVDGDPVAQVDALFELAARCGAGIDMHLHDTGTLGAWEIELVARRTVEHGLQGRVALSHADAMGTVPRADRQRLTETLAESGVALVTAAVYDVPVPSPVGMREAGVLLAAGSDGIRDLWGPYGNGDMLQRAMHVAYRNGLRRDEDIALALECATTNGARLLGLPDGGPYGVEVGAPGDLVLVRARTVAEAVVSFPVREVVVKAGRVVAREGRLVA